MKKTLVLLIAIACALIASAPVKAQSYYYQLGLDSFYGNTLPPVGSDAYYWFWRGEQENDPYCARLLVAGMILIDPHPENNVSEIVQMINKWYKKDEKISLLASSFYLPPVLDFNPGTITLHGNIKYDYKNGVKNDWSKALYYAKYAYEKQNTGDGDADRFYNRLLSVCYRDGIGGYDQNIRKAAKLAASTGDNSLLPLVFADARTLLDLYNILEECLPSEVNRFDDSSGYLSWWSNFYSKRETLTADFFNLSAERMSAVYFSLPAIVQNWLDSSLTGKTGEILLNYPNREIVKAQQKTRSDTFISNLNRAIQNENKVSLQNAFNEAKDLESNCLLADGTLDRAKSAIDDYLNKILEKLKESGNYLSNAETALSLADIATSAFPDLFAGDVAISNLNTVLNQVKAFIRASASNTSSSFQTFLNENPDAPSSYVMRARAKYQELLTQEQDDAAFEAAFALTKAPTSAQKERILSMPMTDSMHETVEKMLRPKYIRQHNQSASPQAFRNSTLDGFKGIDMSYWWKGISGDVNFIAGGIGGNGIGYSTIGVNVGSSYIIHIPTSLSVYGSDGDTFGFGIKTGLYYLYLNGTFRDKDNDMEISNALNMHYLEIPAIFSLYGLSTAINSSGKVGSDCLDIGIGVITRIGMKASGWYAGTKYDNLYQSTSFFKPFDVRPAIDLRFAIFPYSLSAGIDLGIAQSGGGFVDWCFRIGLSWIL